LPEKRFFIPLWKVYLYGVRLLLLLSNMPPGLNSFIIHEKYKIIIKVLWSYLT
jgi:hypothetical protein